MKRLFNISEKIEEWFLAILLSVVVTLVLAQVISRYLFAFPMGWSVELSRYIFVWIAWISASYAVQKNSHIRVEILKDRLKENYKKIFDLIALLIWFTFAAFLAIAGTQFIMLIGKTNQNSPSLEVPMWIVYLGVPIAGLLMAIRLIQQIIIILQEKNVET